MSFGEEGSWCRCLGAFSFALDICMPNHVLTEPGAVLRELGSEARRSMELLIGLSVAVSLENST